MTATRQDGNAIEVSDERSRPVDFLGVELCLASGVLVPRSETELLAREAITLLEGLDGPARVVDMCCGSGNLAIAIALAHPSARIWASDLTDQTVTTTILNRDRHGLADRLTVHQGDMFAPLEGHLPPEGIDLIVANPPYISSTKLETERRDLLEDEPREAFDGGPYGISILQRLTAESHRLLVPGGWLAFEFGVGQARQAAALIARAKAFGPPRFINDTEGNPRVAVARKV